MIKQCAILFIVYSMVLLGQTSGDQIAFQRALSAPTDSAKLEALQKFVKENPSSNLIPNAYAVKFQVYSNLKNDSGAYFSVKKYLSLLDQSQLVPAMNAVAMEFAQRMFYVDSAAVLIDSAIALHSKEEPVLLNTKALVLFRLKKFDEAMFVQERAVSMLPANAKVDARYVSLYVQLGFIQFETGRYREGMQKIILGNLVLPKQSLPVEKIDSLLSTKHFSSSPISVLRDSLYHTAISEFVMYSADSVMAKSNLAVSLSRNNVFPDVALQYGLEAYAESRQRTIEERSGASAALGLTQFNLKRYPDAEKYLTEAAKYASPNETEIFKTLGEVKEKLGKKREAFDAYLSGAMGTRSTSLYDKLIELKNELFPTISLDSIIVARQAAALQFTPEEFQRMKQELKKNEYDRIVLAELFTGSECRPCQAADVAFDYLIERFKSSSIAILEYHLHIPQPDPLVNNDGEKRGEYYGVNSTPTAIFGGTTVITSGGGRLLAKNKFYLYSDIIEQQLKKPTSAAISLSASMKNNVVSIKAKALAASTSGSLRLHIALVEDEVFYKGANGIDQHKFVVRTMLYQTPIRKNIAKKSSSKKTNPEIDGFVFPKEGMLTVNQTLNLNTVIAELEKYYTQTNERFLKLGVSLKEKKTKIDPKHLAIVAFVQDEETREVLQAATEKIVDTVTKK
ncbi:MAG: hypothetical protein WDA22_07940 [Bacteroidota bacterium]